MERAALIEDPRHKATFLGMPEHARTLALATEWGLA
jgi:hypothetical protein